MSSSIIASVVTGGTNSHQTVSEELNNVATDFVTQGVVGTFTSGSPNTGAFAVTQNTGSDMAIAILLGRAYVSGTPSGQDAQVLSARMTANYTAYTINSNSSGSTKFDWIYLSFSAANASTPDTAADNVINLFTSRSSSNATDNGSPPTYGLLLAVVTVANGATSITNGNITDKRVQSQLSVQSATTTGWQTLGFPLTYGANNGSKEFTVTTPNNLTGILSPGMKLNITRSVTPSSQCMAFTSASSQYATKASPSGITFTSAFTCEAWIYLKNYTSQIQGIISRYDNSNSTAGWAMQLRGDGTLQGFYISSSGATSQATVQSIPLNQWTHVAVTVTASTKTITTYINGIAVPVQTQFASAATSIVQLSTNLSVGAVGAGASNTFFNGYISEARVWSVAQSTASIQANMAINCVGNETNLVALFGGNGNFTDATSNANTLTATNGAIATQANNPYNAIEYAFITSVSYSNPTTTLTLFTGMSGTIPNQTLNIPQYSTVKSPYGFPSSDINWCVEYISYQTGVQSSPSAGTWYNPGTQLSIPTGPWSASYEAVLENNNSATTSVDGNATLSTANNSQSDPTFTSHVQQNGAVGNLNIESSVKKTRPLTLTSQTIYYLNTAVITNGGGTNVGFLGAKSPTIITAKLGF